MILIGLAIQLSAQDVPSKWKIKGSHARSVREGKRFKYSSFRVEGNYLLHKNFEAGVFVGYNKMSRYTFYTRNPSFGVSGNFQILPLLLNPEGLKLDVYLHGEYGGYYLRSKTTYFSSGFMAEYALGGGFAYYPWRHVGLYIEYSQGSNTDLRYGISIRF